jgi:hypothetical protein
MRQDEMQAQAWDACAAEAVRCGLLSAEEGRILSSRKSEMNPESFAARLSRLSMEAMESQGRTTWHRIEPELIEMFHRYQCEVCKSWISYSEETGKWRHL